MVTKLINFTNESLSFGVITVCAVCVFILIANILRRKIPLFRRSLMPTAVIAGLLGLAVKEIILALTGYNIFNTIILSGLVYHLLPVGFIALCLREKDNYENEFNKGKVKIQRVAATKSGSVIISTYLIQAIVGIIVTVILGSFFMPQLNKAVGIMLPLGYGQGPQQASATGYIWDAAGYMKAWGPDSARNFGLTIAAFGFLWASIPGIILVNQAAKRKGVVLDKNEFQTSGDLPSYRIEGPDEVPLSESIDKFSLQVCMVGGVYLLTIGIILLIEMLFRASGVGFLIDLIPTFWGFAFMLAALVALGVKMILRRLVKKGIMHRKYPNSYLMNRISGAAFDVSITAALFLISVVALGSLWIPVLLVSAAGGFISIFYLRRLCDYIYKDYKDEAFLAFYGMLTGTIANGMILLREIDKSFETPASDDLVIGSSAAIILGFPLLLLIAQAPKTGNLWWVTTVIVIYFLALLVYMLRPKLFGKKKAKA
jgi:ESS family glutamate:Na+ symporter